MIASITGGGATRGRGPGGHKYGHRRAPEGT
jgi:hypothetical protein